MGISGMTQPEIKEHEREHAPLERSFQKLLTPFEIFLNSQSTSGIVLLCAALLAFFLANSEFRSVYESFNQLPLSLSLGDWRISHSLQHWVNDGLMVLFFFVLGLEIKRECLVGDLSDIRQAGLVICMALGGMLVPASLYALFTYSGEADLMRGWGIPMATDTAFALGILALLGSRAPRSAAVVLSALAIVDDIGAVLVIGLFYTEQINVPALVNAGLVVLLLFIFNIVGIRRPLFYLAGGLVLWWFILHSGVHATAAGVLAAMAVPTRPYAGTSWFIRRMGRLVQRFEELDKPDQSILEEHRQHDLAEQAQQIAMKTTTPLQHWGSALDKPVSLTIMPLFAFLNAGVAIPSSLTELQGSPVMLGTAAGLVIGKATGICAFAWLGVRTGLTSLPKGLTFTHIAGLSLLAGIGFTMSLFIAALAFESQPALLVQAKLGILYGSLIAGVLGTGLLVLTHRLKA